MLDGVPGMRFLELLVSSIRGLTDGTLEILEIVSPNSELFLVGKLESYAFASTYMACGAPIKSDVISISICLD